MLPGAGRELPHPAGDRPITPATSANGIPNTSCSRNEVRSAGDNRSSTTSSAMLADSSSVTRSAGPGPRSSTSGSGSPGPT